MLTHGGDQMATVNVLVVDDDDEFRKSVEEGLADVAHVVGTATPIEALWAMERARFDVLLCDLRLATSTTGLDVLATVKELWPQVGRILITGFGSQIDCDVAAHAMLGKPCDMRSLRSLLRLLPALVPQDSARAEESGDILCSAHG